MVEMDLVTFSCIHRFKESCGIEVIQSCLSIVDVRNTLKGKASELWSLPYIECISNLF
jgi:hypothetical protein